MPGTRTETMRAVAVLTTPDPATFLTARHEWLDLDLGGIPGDRHHGVARPAGSWDRHPTGGTLRNRRQLSAVSVEECAVVAEAIGVDRVEPEWLGANLLLAGWEDLTRLPIGTLLAFPSGATLACEGDNPPCRQPGDVLEEHYPDRERLSSAWLRAAVGRRGILLSVECPGRIAAGDPVGVAVPEPAPDPLVGANPQASGRT